MWLVHPCCLSKYWKGSLAISRLLGTDSGRAKLGHVGLDAIEIVISTEEFFGIAIEDEEAAAARTVGDLYRLVCSKLELQAMPSPLTSETLPKVTEKEKVFFVLGQAFTPAAPTRGSAVVLTECMGLPRLGSRRSAGS